MVLAPRTGLDPLAGRDSFEGLDSAEGLDSPEGFDSFAEEAAELVDAGSADFCLVELSGIEAALPFERLSVA